MQANYSHDIIGMLTQKVNNLELDVQGLKEQNTKLKEQIKPVNYFNTKCEKGHFMRANLLASFSKLTRFCDKCNISLSKLSNVVYQCNDCGYDLCAFCGGYSTQVCIFNHPLDNLKDYTEKGRYCDICQEKDLKRGKHCSCRFDVCQKCIKLQEEKPKVRNEQKIEEKLKKKE